VAVHATGGSGQIERHGGGGTVSGSHVPEMSIGVPVHRRFEDEAVGGEQVGAAAAALTEVVEEFALVVDERIARTVEGEPDMAVFIGDFVVNTGGFVGEFTGDQIFSGRTAGIGHGGAHVGFEDLGVAFGARLVADIGGGTWILRRGLLCKENQRTGREQ